MSTNNNNNNNNDSNNNNNNYSSRTTIPRKKSVLEAINPSSMLLYEVKREKNHFNKPMLTKAEMCAFPLTLSRASYKNNEAHEQIK